MTAFWRARPQEKFGFDNKLWSFIAHRQENIYFPAVSRKVVLQTRKSLRDNVESYYG